ncbi:MAG TPA: MFS transporter [Kiritimatiellia bacterium]|nr:MFS transporter [Kiritimatiellia bacterium]HMO99757.1 MFS transporter [Kiritimatiellia bacterium]HMP00028.1 MFS transporter [Kiritimatiellia bacterium]HMP97363.1 MFS transporter [Kiritimatiellia bacterium]
MTKSADNPEHPPRVAPDPNYKPPLETESIDDPNMLPPDPETDAGTPAADAGRKDAPRKEVVLYAFGNVEASIADQFFNVLNSIMVVAMHVNPMLLGLIAGIKTLWDGITDPIMAYVTDNTRTRWGRRRPFILVGGVLRIALLVLIVAFMPSGGNLMRNQVMEAQKFANEAIREASDAWRLAVQSHEQLEGLPPDRQAILLDALEKRSDTARDTLAKLDEHQPTLQEDLELREADAVTRRENVETIRREMANAPDLESKLTIPEGLFEAATEKVTKARDLLAKMDQARRELIAADHVATYLLVAHGRRENPAFATEDLTRQVASDAFATAGVEPLDDIFTLPVRPPPAPGKSAGMWANIIDGAKAFWAPKNFEQRPLILYTLIAVLLFTTLTTVQSVPYYALGIEVSPSYNGRTQVVTYRAIMNQIAGLVQPWIPVLCFSLVFLTALEGLFWVAVVACVIGIPSTILMCWFVKERTEISASKNREAGLFKSMWQVMQSRHFLKIFALYWLIGLSFGVFTQIGFYLNVYWVMGSALAGAKLLAWVSMLAWGLGFITLPLINWGCRRFQKHRVLQFAIVWMAIGTVLKWWCMNPDHPEYQFILPFFFSVGISSVYTVLPTMMADVTDVDELNHGARREGMFGAVMAFLMKIIGTFTPILGGAVLVMSGFDPSLEYEQAPSTIFNMRVMYSFVSAAMLITALVILWRYPLTRERIQEIKAELHKRHLAKTT